CARYDYGYDEAMDYW
nr:immunoglobulin heavy chain junction region [Mus musculus]